MIKQGDIVKYIGTNSPKYTGKNLEVERVIEEGVILYYPKEDRGFIYFEGLGVMKDEALICGFDEIQIAP